VKGAKLCLKQAKPFAAPISYCTPVPSSMGKPWTAKAVTGEQITVKLVEGHVRGKLKTAQPD
jgi:hypothetical protein